MKLIRYKYPQATGPAALNRLLNFGVPSSERFSGLLEGFLGSGVGCRQPAADLYEDDANFYVRMELPGIPKARIDLQMEDSVLMVRSQEIEQDGDSESADCFHRAVSVPDGVEVEAIKANYQDGMLTVTLPKQAAPQPRKITVK
ncbi:MULTISPECIES: Hsp20/alpha crystallin family protein [unclassified Lentimonas]|uniref:Hsp20/alpha crystallin family protein n=1 Tax=unclassified Lentimonas TaxID=2630993 RepID=UPI00132085B3|nr:MULTISPECIES: Hsp20/alpha crystallin family protein [unclassified Lentimonas]CAA6679466.1 Unannotated [Lentimonas sp. CC4]CAA6687137.1 Unannotated [Lentimonas sp. CC6]CAA7075516.1 Unannotated [Lentimonas sp. CC4]CAA7170283.1 Unannotated [Lentimonas sp. CC21]CAA7182577.1 Unannotated [Lentimonas sp. CC8]